MQSLALLYGCCFRNCAAPVDTGRGGIGLDIQGFGEGLLHFVKSDLFALYRNCNGVRNGFAVIEFDGYGNSSVCGGIGFGTEAGKIACHFDFHRRFGIRSHEIQVDGIRIGLEGEGIAFITYCQVVSQRSGLQVIGPVKGFIEVPFVMTSISRITGVVIPREEAVVIVDVQSHTLSFDLVADVVEGVSRRISHADLSFAGFGGHDYDGPLVHIIVEHAEVPASVVGDLSDGDGRCGFGTGLHSRSQTQGGTDLHIDAVDGGKQSLRLHAVKLHVVVGVEFRILIAAVVITLNGHPEIQTAGAVVGVIIVLGNGEGTGDGSAIHGLDLSRLGGIFCFHAVLHSAQQQITVGESLRVT